MLPSLICVAFSVPVVSHLVESLSAGRSRAAEIRARPSSCPNALRASVLARFRLDRVSFGYLWRSASLEVVPA
eukprot:7714767-Lingulodinium_polyedra.AAC.1